MKWSETTIITPQGPKPAIAPLVISASRATDIPAFHAKWFMNRLRAGYCLWENAFNAHQRCYVSFEKCKVFVFWSKNPQALMPYLSEVEERGYQYYFQYTLNNYEQKGLEPRIPRLAQRIATFQELSERIGKHRVIWRFDPVILGNTLTVESVLERIQHLAEQLAPHTEKLVFSFLDMYKKTGNNLKKLDPLLRPPDAEEARRLAEGIAQINKGLGSPLTLATCAEELNVASLGIGHNKCVDPELLLRLCPASSELRTMYARRFSLQLGGLRSVAGTCGVGSVKDRGQRSACGCAPSKDIGRYNTCMHLCAYCYANRSKIDAIKGINATDSNSEHL